ncbi:MAG TPA: DUF2817 domain-containing protein [Acidimicrobiaceae bacterium]|nr:DUF2817 domain-containing protein [Acidimicrobiaceae bacterium]
MTTGPFSASFAEARAAFVEAATAAGASLSSHAHPETGPDGGALTTDCAWIGPADAAKVLVLVSGTHGVEGFCGSGAQVDWLRRREFTHLAPDSAVLLVHAINPYGFAWKRRVTHENVDLNRNFVDFSRPLPENPGYVQLASAVTPEDWSEETQIACRRVLLDFARTHGFEALAQAMSGGQYTHPDGLFFGGSGPTWSRTTLETIFADHLSQATDVGIVDFHTGLGPEGYAEPIIAAPPGTPEYERAMHWHGLAATSHAGGDSVSAQIAGDWLAAAPSLLPRARVTGVALEYGTVPSNRVLDALRADNWLHAYGDPLSPEGQAIKAQMLAAFYIDTDIWRGMVLGQSLTAVRQTMRGLARTDSP